MQSCFAAEFLHDFDIRISSEIKSDVMEMPVCTHFKNHVGNGVTLHLTCDCGPMVGQSLVVSILGEREILTLTEIAVYGGEYCNPKEIASCKTKFDKPGL